MRAAGSGERQASTRSRCNRCAFNPVPRKRCGNKAGRFHLLDKRRQVARPCFASFGQAHGLLNHHETPVEESQTGQTLGVRLQLLSDTGSYLEFLRQELIGHQR